MSYFLKSGNTFRVATKDALDLHEALPAGNYVIKQDPFENLFIEHIEDFDVPAKLYGSVHKQTERVVSTFLKRDKSTGILMTGEKGSGKTMLSKNICIELAQLNIPTIVINQPWHGEKFNTLIQAIQQPCIVLFDEFEKVYDREQQEQMLTLLDGVYSTQKLFILTCNDRWRVDSHMRNRPGRIYYYFDFKGLEEEFIREYCNDNLNNKNHIDTLANIAGVFSAFNFDMLKATVEEMNRYNESPQDALKMLNAKPEFNNGGKFSVQLVVDGEPVKDPGIRTEWNGNPLTGGVYFEWYSKTNYNLPPSGRGVDIGLAIATTAASTADDEGEFYNEIEFAPNNIVKVDANEGKFTYQIENAFCILTRKKEQSYNYLAF